MVRRLAMTSAALRRIMVSSRQVISRQEMRTRLFVAPHCNRLLFLRSSHGFFPVDVPSREYAQEPRRSQWDDDDTPTDSDGEIFDYNDGEDDSEDGETEGSDLEGLSDDPEKASTDSE